MSLPACSLQSFSYYTTETLVKELTIIRAKVLGNVFEDEWGRAMGCMGNWEYVRKQKNNLLPPTINFLGKQAEAKGEREKNETKKKNIKKKKKTMVQKKAMPIFVNLISI